MPCHRSSKWLPDTTSCGWPESRKLPDCQTSFHKLDMKVRMSHLPDPIRFFGALLSHAWWLLFIPMRIFSFSCCMKVKNWNSRLSLFCADVLLTDTPCRDCSHANLAQVEDFEKAFRLFECLTACHEHVLFCICGTKCSVLTGTIVLLICSMFHHQVSSSLSVAEIELWSPTIGTEVPDFPDLC